MEIWKEINGYENLYEISNTGKVKSLRYNKILSGGYSGFGYLLVHLVKDSKKKQKYIHKLVAEAFIPNEDNKPQVNHIDGNKTNNNVDNLEWVSFSENNKHAYKTGLKKSSKGKNNDYSRSLMTPINQYDLDGNFIKRWNSQREITNELNIPQQNISLCVRGKRNKTHNYIWKYANNSGK